MNEAKQKSRHKKIIDTMKAGDVPTPEALDVSRTTLWRDLKALQEQAVLSLDTEGLKAIKQQQYQVQLRMEQALLEGVLDPATVTAWNKVRESIAKLLGLNAPARSESVNVNVEADAQNLVGYRKFVVATRHLDEAQMSTVYDFIAAIPARPPVELVIPDVDLDALQLKGETECES
jgi:hypothetical protein